MNLRHYPVFNGAVMAQTGCAVIELRLKEKTMAFFFAPLVFSNGGATAQWRTNHPPIPSSRVP
jgi:hypothetical protein